MKNHLRCAEVHVYYIHSTQEKRFGDNMKLIPYYAPETTTKNIPKKIVCVRVCGCLRMMLFDEAHMEFYSIFIVPNESRSNLCHINF